MSEIHGEESPDTTLRRFLDSGVIRLQICGDCGRQIFPPRVLCPRCGGVKLVWSLIAGDGTVYSTTVVRRRVDRGGDYNVCIVELDEGARMLSRVNDVEPTSVQIGDRVQAVIDSIDDRPVLAFVRKSEADS